MFCSRTFKATSHNMDVPLSREETIRLYKQSADRARAGRGTPYDCTQKDIDDFHKLPRQTGNPIYKTPETSIKELTSFLTQRKPCSDARQALSRLRDAVRPRMTSTYQLERNLLTKMV